VVFASALDMDLPKILLWFCLFSVVSVYLLCALFMFSLFGSLSCAVSPLGEFDFDPAN
jgi:hypothetical protein